MKAVILSNALDTNGQNARYVRASEKWGTDPDVLKALAIGHYDPASVVGRFQHAAEKYGELSIRSVHRAQHIYQQMPADIVWTRKNGQDVMRLAQEADVIHLNNSTIAARRLRIRRDKPFLLHHHGSLFRNNAEHMLREARRLRAVQATSTVDLLRFSDELHWLPTAYDIDWLQQFGDEHRRPTDDVIRVVQAPTDGKNGVYKSTAALEAAVAKVQAKGVNLELIVVRDKPWAECMAIKATADIYFDQVKLGYGCNAVEAWGMGIPVIAGADDWTLAKMREVYGTDQLPFYIAAEDTIEYALLDLASSKVLRRKYAARGMEHVRKFHDEKPALVKLAALYRMAIDKAATAPAILEPPAVVFRATVPQVLAAGRYITFTDGQATISNPNIATALRKLAVRRPSFGIEEVTDAA